MNHLTVVLITFPSAGVGGRTCGSFLARAMAAVWEFCAPSGEVIAAIAPNAQSVIASGALFVAWLEFHQFDATIFRAPLVGGVVGNRLGLAETFCGKTRCPIPCAESQATTACARFSDRV